MEAAKEEGNLLSTIRPPRLEDAGLEDCALSHESIKEAFFKAAKFLRSLPGSDVESDSEDHCIKGKTFLPPNDGSFPGSLIEVAPNSDPPGSCLTEKGGVLPEDLGDEVRVGGESDQKCEERSDKVLDWNVPEASCEGGERACVDGLQGMKIHENDDNDQGRDEERVKNPS